MAGCSLSLSLSLIFVHVLCFCMVKHLKSCENLITRIEPSTQLIVMTTFCEKRNNRIVAEINGQKFIESLRFQNSAKNSGHIFTPILKHKNKTIQDQIILYRYIKVLCIEP